VPAGNDRPALESLQRPQREAYYLPSPGGGVEFHPGYGEWISILRTAGFTVDALHEVYAPPGADTHPYYRLATADWARQWPVEEIWVTHLTV
jgi:hypothetical protein